MTSSPPAMAMGGGGGFSTSFGTPIAISMSPMLSAANAYVPSGGGAMLPAMGVPAGMPGMTYSAGSVPALGGATAVGGMSGCSMHGAAPAAAGKGDKAAADKKAGEKKKGKSKKKAEPNEAQANKAKSKSKAKSGDKSTKTTAKK